MSSEIWVWRHPRPEGAAGRCIGAGTDLDVHWRRAKRLARRIQRLAKRERLPHIVHCSPLRRCADVGRWLEGWGWQLRQDPTLRELEFGTWDGQPWALIDKAAVDAWVHDFATHAPGGGESLLQLLARAQAWSTKEGCIVISHGGWMLARRWHAEHGDSPPASALDWPAAPGYGQLWRLA